MMTYRLRAEAVWRAMRNGVAQVKRLLAEAGSSDEDLVFHIRNSEESRPLDRRPRTCSPPKP